MELRGWLGTFGILVAVAAAWFAELQARRPPAAGPRRVHELQRKIKVLDAEDASYLASLYRHHNESFPQSYYNLLAHRWNTQDDRLGSIFKKVVDAANSVDGGSGDYVISNDFFSYRAPSIAQFAPEGAFHHDCDFWKLDAGDGFNVWILVDHQGLDTSFDVAQRHANPKLYEGYAGDRPLLLFPEHRTNVDSLYRIIGLQQGLFLNGHKDILNWRATLQARLKPLLQYFNSMRRKKKAAFGMPAPVVTNLKLEVGEALVLREQEFHRTDLHKSLSPGQFRLAAGFKLLRRNATVTQFYAQCPAQKERMSFPALWEEIGKPIKDLYLERPPGGRRLWALDLKGRIALIVTSNTGSLVGLAGMAVVAGPLGAKWTSQRRASVAAAALGLLLLVCVAALQWEWVMEVNQTALDRSGRRTSALQVPR